MAQTYYARVQQDGGSLAVSREELRELFERNLPGDVEFPGLRVVNNMLRRDGLAGPAARRFTESVRRMYLMGDVPAAELPRLRLEAGPAL